MLSTTYASARLLQFQGAMRRTEYQRNQLAMLTGLLWAVGKAMAQEQENAPERRIVISIPDRKLALVENGKVATVYQTAVGAPKSPSPGGRLTGATRLQHPTGDHAGKDVP